MFKIVIPRQKMSLSNQGIMALKVPRIFLFLFYDSLAHNKYHIWFLKTFNETDYDCILLDMVQDLLIFLFRSSAVEGT